MTQRDPLATYVSLPTAFLINLSRGYRSAICKGYKEPHPGPGPGEVSRKQWPFPRWKWAAWDSPLLVLGSGMIVAGKSLTFWKGWVQNWGHGCGQS